MTPAFDHRDSGTPEQAWQDRTLSDLARLAVPGADERVVVVAAHPDDETLGPGGLIAAAGARGAQLHVVIATDGEASHPESPTHTPSELAAIRRVEVQYAVAELSPAAQVTFLGLPDGRLADEPGKLAVALRGPLREATLVVTPWRDDRHPDHAACAEAAASVLGGATDVRHWQYPIWAWHWADPAQSDIPWDRMARIDLTRAEWTAKLAALSCHRSQHSPLSDAPGDEAILPAPILAHFVRVFECFVLDEITEVSTAAPAAESAYFDQLYEQADDPWGLADRFYEERKRALLMAVLPRPRFRRAFEPGCATGELSVLLAERCEELIAWDGAQSAVQQTRERLSGSTVEQRRIPEDWPAGELDLVVISEVGYYCPDLGVLAKQIRSSLAADGIVVACHWRHAAPDHPHDAESVHAAIGAGLHRIVRHVEDDFLLDVWARTPLSVASWEGIVS